MSYEGEFYPAQTVVYCDFCDTHVNVTWVCHTCDVSICQKCKDIHLGKKKFRDHTVRLRGEETTETTIKSTECRKHSSFDCSAFCETCKVPACIKCVVDDHKDHDVLELKEAFDKYKVRLRSIKDTYRSQYVTQVRERRERLQYENERVKAEATAGLKYLKKEHTEAMTAVSKVYEKLEKDVIEGQENQQNKIDESLKSLNESEGVIEEVLEQCEKHEASLDISIFKFVNECPVSADLPDEVCVSQIKVIPGSITSSYIEERAGRVMLESGYESESKVPPLQSNVSVVDKRMIRSFMAPFSDTGTEYRGAHCIQHGELDTVWMSNNSSSELHLYDSRGSRVTTISVGFEIWGFEMDSNEHFIATDYDHKKLKKISKTGTVTTLISSLPSKPCGVCLNHKQEIVLSFSLTEALYVYSPDGRRLVHKIGEGGGLFRQPYRLAQNGNKDYCVIDNKKVVVVDVGGSFRWKYSGQQGEKFDPRNVVCDSYQCLIISNYISNNIHLLDKDGHFIQTLLTKDDGIDYPRGLCVDKDGRLWVGQNDGKVYVVKYRSKWNS